ncbi:MAG TPA: CZB domain-containing protein [Bryobacteraceae bacterium]|nr:CZB domain-containing protein [Bryobacteraceae bacterium]
MTTVKDQIEAAIGAHGLWKGRLRAAIDNGRSDMPVATVRDDHQCSFGRWLFGQELDNQEKKSRHYKICVDLHRRFHLAAADVMALALAGKKQEAAQALEGNRDFKALSTELTRALMVWKDA